jgi:acyl-CoA thioesterase
MDAVVTSTEPIFSADGDGWVPHIEASGPFRGLHGGAVSGLTVAVMEHMAREEDFGIPTTATVFILRPAPSERLQTRVTPLRVGGRIAILESELLAGDKLIAKATAAFVKPIDLPELSAVEAPKTPVDPASMPAWQRTHNRDRVTFFDALDIRDDGKGTKWGRMKRPMMPYDAPFASLFALSDNGTPYWLSGTEFWPPRWGFPNIDVALHVSRPRVGAWVGVAPTSDWRVEGNGLTEAAIYDEQGLLGRGCQTVVVTPM